VIERQPRVARERRRVRGVERAGGVTANRVVAAEPVSERASARSAACACADQRTTHRQKKTSASASAGVRDAVAQASLPWAVLGGLHARTHARAHARGTVRTGYC
jgi:hypothetical protein